jgi:rubredoxin
MIFDFPQSRRDFSELLTYHKSLSVMKIRTCPLCGYQYSLYEYVGKVIFKIVDSEWNCPVCKKKITFDFSRRVIVALCCGAFYIIISLLISVLNDVLGMSPLIWIAVLSIYLIFSIFIFTFDTFKKAD